jgi:hypothetical protein
LGDWVFDSNRRASNAADRRGCHRRRQFFSEDHGGCSAVLAASVETKGQLMARIKGVTESNANDDVQQIIAEQKKRHGFVSNAAQVSAIRPTIQQGVQALAQGIQDSGLIAQELRNLVCVRTAHINGCPY